MCDIQILDKKYQHFCKEHYQCDVGSELAEILETKFKPLIKFHSHMKQTILLE